MLMNPKRFAKMIIESYKKIGFKPIQRDFIKQNSKECCGLSAYYLTHLVSKYDSKKYNRDVEEECSKVFDSKFVVGFITAFDSFPTTESEDKESKYKKSLNYINGYNCGKETMKELTKIYSVNKAGVGTWN